jgi:hypothetical protein
MSSSTLSRKVDAFNKAIDLFVNSTHTRTNELAQNANRLTNKENTSNTLLSNKTPRIPWHSTLEDLNEQLESLTTSVKDTPRLERLVGLSENALDAFERLVDQAENLATIKYGYNKNNIPAVNSTITSKDQQQQQLQQNNIYDGDDDPPTPPRLTSSSVI